MVVGVKKEGRSRRSESVTFVEPSYKYSKRLSMSLAFDKMADDQDSLEAVSTEEILEEAASDLKISIQGDLIILFVGFGVFLIIALLLFFCSFSLVK